jgi:hypothetical protein
MASEQGWNDIPTLYIAIYSVWEGQKQLAELGNERRPISISFDGDPDREKVIVVAWSKVDRYSFEDYRMRIAPELAPKLLASLNS